MNLQRKDSLQEHLINHVITDNAKAELIATRITSELANMGVNGLPTLGPLASVANGNPPDILIGLLTFGDNCDLILRDNTFSLTCIFEDFDFTSFDRYIVVQDFQYIKCLSHSYLEVSNYHSIYAPEDSISSVSVASSDRTSNVTGLVAAVSTPIGKNDCCVFIQLCNPSGKLYIIIKDPFLLFTYRYIDVGKCYTFNGLKDSILNKGLPNEHRVKVTTPVSRITRELTLSQDTPHLCVPSNLASYQGEITRVMIPEAGLLELDNSIRVYLCHLANHHNGLREGVTVCLSNVHVVKINHTKWQFLCGFACCIYSSISIVQFSRQHPSNYKPFLARNNRLKRLLSQYPVPHAALMLEVYSYCRGKLRISDVDSILSILRSFISLLDPAGTHEREDPVSAFLSSPHHCSILSSAPDTLPTSFPTICKFFEEHCKDSVVGVTCGCGQSLSWSYTDVIINKVIIGYLISSSTTDSIAITELATTHEHQIAVVAPTLSHHIGGYIVITKLKLIQEHTCHTDATSTCPSTVSSYIVPLEWRAVHIKPSRHSIIPNESRHCSYFIVKSKNRPVKDLINGCNSFEAQVYMSSHIEGLSHTTTRTQHVLRISDVTRYYGYLQHGCLYSLVSKEGASLSPSIDVTTSHVIELLEEADKWNVLQFKDISELVNSTAKSASSLVSFTGVILDRSYRLASVGVVNHEVTIAINIKSITTPDAMFLYIHPPDSGSALLGLLPGAKVSFVQVVLKFSRAGNVYCSYCGHSSIRVLEFPRHKCAMAACHIDQQELPIVRLNTLLRQFRERELPRNVVCLVGRIDYVQFIKMELGCSVHSLSTAGCLSSCEKTHTIKSEGSVSFTDGSGQCTLYFDSDVAQRLLKCDQSKWTQLAEFVRQQQSLKYYRMQQPQNAAEKCMCNIARSTCLATEMRVHCKPFTSSTQPMIKGIATRKLKVQNVSYTVEIPSQNKLQLKVISVQDINYKQTAMQLYDMLLQSVH